MKTGFILWILFTVNGLHYEKVSQPFATRAECEKVRKHYKPMVDRSQCYYGTVKARTQTTGSK